MKIFSYFYDKALKWAAHKHAPVYLGTLSVAESSFFPIPPDVMLIPMVMAKRHIAWRLATLTTVTSVFGGIIGYALGLFFYNEVGQPVIEFYHAEQAFERVKAWFNDYGIWIVFIAGFSPIPYKLFTITSGVMSMAFIPFVLASFIGRGARFYLVTGVLYWGGDKFADFIRRRIDLIGWSVVATGIIVYVISRFV